MTAPVKGTVWLHAKRTDWNGEPLALTVTSITNGKVYSAAKYRDGRIKTPLHMFDTLCKEIVSVPDAATRDNGPRLTAAQCSALFVQAHEAGMAAGNACVPTPMVVVQRANPLDDTSPIVRQYEPIMGGVCGFAYVTIRPGNSSFATYLRKSRGGYKAYYGGVQMSVHHFGQSMECKVAYASAFAKVLTDAGIKAYPESRMD